MSELHGHAGARHLVEELCTLPCLALEGLYVGREGLGECVVGHVEEPEADLSDAGVGDVEVAAVDDALDEVLGHRLAGLIMGSEGVEEVGLDGEVLHQLRGQLYEVPIDAGAREAGEARVGEDAVQGVAEFVEEGFHFAEREQCGLRLGGFGEVHHE